MTEKNKERLRMAAGIGGWSRLAPECTPITEVFCRGAINGVAGVKIYVHFDVLGRVQRAARGLYRGGVLRHASYLRRHERDRCSKVVDWLVNT